MKSYLLSALCALSFLSGCESDNNEAQPRKTTPVDTGVIRYDLNGAAFIKPGKATYQAASTATNNQDALILSGEGKTSTGAIENIQLYYSKPAGAAESPYTLTAIYTESNTARPAFTLNLSGIAKKDGAGWSGSFSGKRANSQGQIVETITDGAFTQVKP